MQILAKSVGRRKEAVAQVQILRGSGLFIINNKPAQEYLQNDSCSLISVKAPFEFLLNTKSTDNGSIYKDSLNELSIDTIVKVKGGGLMGQAEAIRLGIARALCLFASNEKPSYPPIAGDRRSNVPEVGNVGTGTGKELGKSDNSNFLDQTLSSNSNEDKGLDETTIYSLDVRKQLKDKGYLTQDSRVKERRKYGLKKARKASQYHKR
jgi:small subunit ribosomal protein S9